MGALFKTEDSVILLILRIMLGIVMFPHGAQKVVGWFGGQGFSATMDLFTQQMGIPAFVAFLVFMAEFLGSIGLVVGFLTRIAAFGILCNMIGAIILVHWKVGFFMNWFGTLQGEGFEYHLLAIAMALALVIGGGGKASIDRYIAFSSRRRWHTE